ncbi:uncharacterized protein LOC110694334 [Chenopodium quinoa]|uniref:uncharacterized protein LOC110694334 n=1 Tax=Chenopodium quinoa TaxID=63459 RepID=UPI000B771C62|nr:uncharacterized protein LOC110694334 [Chenopodium quinoa]
MYVYLCNLLVMYVYLYNLLDFALNYSRFPYDHVVLRFKYKVHNVDIEVDPDICNLMDLMIEFEDRLQKKGIVLLNPIFAYAYKGKHWPIDDDGGIIRMFRTFPDADIYEILGEKIAVEQANQALHEPPPLNQPPPENVPPPLNQPPLENVPPPLNNQAANPSDQASNPSADDANPVTPLPHPSNYGRSKLQPRRRLRLTYQSTPQATTPESSVNPSLEELASRILNYDPDATFTDVHEEFELNSANQSAKDYTKGRKDFEKYMEKVKGKGKGQGKGKGKGKGKEVAGSFGGTTKGKGKAKPICSGGEKLPPSPMSPHTVFKTLAFRRSPRFSPAQTTTKQPTDIFSSSPNTRGPNPTTNPLLLSRKIPKSTQIRKGIWTGAKVRVSSKPNEVEKMIVMYQKMSCLR